MPCDCATQVNAELEPFNTELDLVFNLFNTDLPHEMAQITTMKVDTKKRGKPKMMIATYCPFCGVKYSSVAAVVE